jgi:Pyruvate/2-oxoacid:ferredoxin oxidoreductase gamma subunit
MSVTTGDAIYPSDALIDIALRAITDKIVYVGGLEIAKSLGNKNLTNSVLLGVLARELATDPGIWLEVLVRRVPQKYVGQNKQAFWAGRV